MQYVLGIDVSTTGAKALLVDECGKVVASEVAEYPLSTPRPLWSEQDPEDWWTGAKLSISRALAHSGVTGKDVVGIGLTGQMHGLVCLDGHGRVLRPAILWNDQRTGPQCERITRLIGVQQLLAWTGNLALPGFTAPKVLWVREREPEVYARIRHILLPKDYIRYKLTGDFATDKAGAAGTLLLDIGKRDWSSQMLYALNIPREWLPPCHEGPDSTGITSEEAASTTGLAAGIPVVAGGGDQSAQAVGVGAVSPGTVALTLGTSGVVFAPTAEPSIEAQGRLHAFCHAVPSRWHLMGVMLSAAGALRWYHDALEPGSSYDDFLSPATRIPAGSEGLLFLPYLTGERTPHADPNARGAFVGLTVRHSRGHMIRSLLEGVAFGLRDSLELLRSAGVGGVEQIRISGGGARSPLWRQIIADVLNCQLVTVDVTEGAAHGAALLAGVGTGVWPDVDRACAEVVHVLEREDPDGSRAERYEELYPIYRDLYGALKSPHDALTAFDVEEADH